MSKFLERALVYGLAALLAYGVAMTTANVVSSSFNQTATLLENAGRR